MRFRRWSFEQRGGDCQDKEVPLAVMAVVGGQVVRTI